jgi:hypothetical protein
LNDDGSPAELIVNGIYSYIQSADVIKPATGTTQAITIAVSRPIGADFVSIGDVAIKFVKSAFGCNVNNIVDGAGAPYFAVTSSTFPDADSVTFAVTVSDGAEIGDYKICATTGRRRFLLLW